MSASRAGWTTVGKDGRIYVSKEHAGKDIFWELIGSGTAKNEGERR